MEIKKISDKNILVTGGTGFVGSHLVEELVKQEANVVTTFITLNPLSYFFQKKLDKKVKMINVDVCDFDKVFDIVTKFSIDYIFHLAAQPLVEVAFYNPKRTLYTNIIGTINILEAVRLYPKIKGFIVASSDKAYGKLEEGKYKENDPLKGDHPYEVSKSSADLISYSYYKTYNLPVVTTRFGNIYGEGDLNFSRIIPGIMKSLIKKELLEIRSDGKYVRDYLYVKDVVDGYLLLLNNIEKIKGEAFNFGSDETLSVLDLIKLVEKYLNKTVNYKILNSAKNEIFYQSLDYSKIKKLGWQPKTKIKDVIKRIFIWYKKILTND
jgi:CDP-glucose 4,6-dehydratase